MILKFTVRELEELGQYSSGDFGQKNFYSFMAEIYYRTDEDSGEVDLDRDDFERIEAYRREGNKERVDKVFKRAMDAAFGKFFG